MTREALEQGRITQASQDGSREFISLLACICADKTFLPPTLIYKGESHDLQDSWLADFTEGDQAFFAASDNGWSSDDLGLQWLERVFERYTKQKAGNRRRLLLVDGHSSHVNLKFLQFADAHRIIILILPPHSTHRLQPLDIGLFAPLARAYTNELNTLMYNSLGFVSMSKRMFWPMFREAWFMAFTEENIASAFQSSGVFPLDPEIVLSIIRPSTSSLSDSISTLPKTPLTSRAVRRAQRAYKEDPTEEKLEVIFRANEKLAAQHEVDEHVKRGLLNVLNEEKKRRRKGKRLNLLGEEDVGPQLFSPGRIQAAKTFQKEKEDAMEQEKLKKIERKAAAEAARQQRDQEKKDRMLERQMKKEVLEQNRAKIQAEREAKREQKEKEKTLAQSQSIVLKAQESTPIVLGAITSQMVEEVGRVSTRGRVITRPQRFNE